MKAGFVLTHKIVIKDIDIFGHNGKNVDKFKVLSILLEGTGTIIGNQRSD